MATVPGAWELAGLVCKLLFYFGAASLAGGTLCLWRYSDGSRRTVNRNLFYIAVGAFLGFQGTFINFLVQVGLINARGLTGMFDWDMAALLLDTALGDATLFRLAGFAVAFVTGLFSLYKISQLRRPPALGFYRLLNSVNLCAFLLLIMSFRFAGHISILGVIAKLAIAVHFFAFAAWIGSLYPLLVVCAGEDLQTLRGIMQRFGRDAVAIVTALIIAGGLMLLELFGSVAELFATSYGIAFLVKLVLVVVILLIAALNKFRLTPSIQRQGNSRALQRSIRMEMAVALLILMVTSYFSTIVGPADLG